MEKEKLKTILVTGGAGYIGSHTVILLQQLGFRVVVIDNLSNSHQFVFDRIQKISGITPVFYEADLCDLEALKRIFQQENSIEASIHFAALKAVGESVEKPLLYYRNNLLSLINLMDVQAEFGIDKLVFSSSCTVYGQPDSLPVTEKSSVKPAASPYGNTKQIGEEMIRDFADVSPIKAIALRYFNPVGAHESAMIGELPIGIPNNLIPYITQTAIGKHKALRVFGNDYDTPDGTCIRDYIHVEDVAAAHVAALKRLMNEKNRDAFEVFNIGTGSGHSVMEVINAFSRVYGRQLPYEIHPRRAGDIEAVYADTSLSNQMLNWKAKKSLEEMMASAWAWEQKLQTDNIKYD